MDDVINHQIGPVMVHFPLSFSKYHERYGEVAPFPFRKVCVNKKPISKAYIELLRFQLSQVYLLVRR